MTLLHAELLSLVCANKRIYYFNFPLTLIRECDKRLKNLLYKQICKKSFYPLIIEKLCKLYSNQRVS